MSYSIKIYNANNELIQGVLDINTSAATYFAACAYMAIDLLNGGKSFNLPNDLSTIAPQGAIVLFLGELHKHPQFLPENVLTNDADTNAILYRALSHLLERKTTEGHADFVKLLSRFKVPGINKIEIEVPAPTLSRDRNTTFGRPTAEQPYGPYSAGYSFPPDSLLKNM